MHGGERCRLQVRNFNPACLDQECGNQHQPGLTRFTNSETRFQQLGLEFGWPHVNTSELSFLGRKEVMTSSLYLPQISNGERGRVYKCQLSIINGLHRKTMSGVKPGSLGASCVLSACAAVTEEYPCCLHRNTIKMSLIQVFRDQNAKRKGTKIPL